jgi:cytochrome c biogenesis factor
MATTPRESAPAATPSSPVKKGVKRSTDITLSIVFLAVQLVVAVVSIPFVFVFGTLAFVMSGAGELFTLFLVGPSVVFLVTLTVSLILMITKRNSWIATLVGLVVTAVPLLLFFIPVIALNVSGT